MFSAPLVITHARVAGWFVLVNVVPFLDFALNAGRPVPAYLLQFSLLAFIAAGVALGVEGGAASTLLAFAGAQHLFSTLVCATIAMCEAFDVDDQDSVAVLYDDQANFLYTPETKTYTLRTSRVYAISAVAFSVACLRTWAFGAVFLYESAAAAGWLALVAMTCAYCAQLSQFMRGVYLFIVRVNMIRAYVYSVSKAGLASGKEIDFARHMHRLRVARPLHWSPLDSCVSAGLATIFASIIYIFIISVQAGQNTETAPVFPWEPMIADALVTLALCGIVSFYLGTLLERYTKIAAAVVESAQLDESALEDKADAQRQARLGVAASVLGANVHRGMSEALGISLAAGIISDAYGRVIYVVIFVAVISRLYPQ